jgi:glycosyltransferase involved in cell wall biosynthesis
MEGMAAALPAVAVESPGIGETVDHEESGLLVADGDGLGGAILRVADDTLRERLATGAVAAADGFDVTERVARFVALYESLLDRG